MRGRGRRPTERAGHVAALLVVVLWAAASGVASGLAVGPNPTCTFAPSVSASPLSGTTPLLVQFNATASAGTPSAFQWVFGDGSFWNASGPGAATPFHRYAAPGTYSITVTEVEAGCGSTASTMVMVVPGPITTLITASPTAGPAPLHVQLNVTITGGTGTYVAVNWTLGDGGAGIGTALRYVYEHPGTFSANVTVVDSAHQFGTNSIAITVSGPSASRSSGIEGLELGVGAAAAFLLVLGVVLVRRARPPGRIEARMPRQEPAPAPLGTTRAGEFPSPPPPRDETPVTPPTSQDSPGFDGVAGVPPVVARRQLSRAVLLHLGGQGRLGPDEVAPAGLTQAGMAQALGVRQNSLTNVLRRFVASGVLTQDVRHVRGRPRRLRVYRLTARGEELYQDVRRRRSTSADSSETPR